MWFLQNLGWLALGFFFFVGSALPLESLWEWRWNVRQRKFLQWEDRKFREERLFEHVCFAIIGVSILGAWFLLRLCMEWSAS